MAPSGAAELGCVPRTLERRLKVLHILWGEEETR
jgi:hypothetical protein